MIKLPWGAIAGGGALLAIIIALIIQGYALKSAKSELEAANLKLVRWEEEHDKCKENQATLDAALVELATSVEKIGDLTVRLEGREEATHRMALDIAAARRELATVSNKYTELRAAAVDLDVCQTYKLALAALSGDPQ